MHPQTVPSSNAKHSRAPKWTRYWRNEPMQKTEREARPNRAKELGRVAYVILRSCEIEGVLDMTAIGSIFAHSRKTSSTSKWSSPLDWTLVRTSFLVS
jgi:hypothetical protein